MKKRIGSILTVIFLAIFIVYFWQNKEDFRILLEISIQALALISLLKIASLFVNSLFTKIVLLQFDKVITHAESFYLGVLSSLGNFFGPLLGGTGLRALYLKRSHDFPYNKFISTLSANYILLFLVYSFTGLLSLSILHITQSVYSMPLYLIFLGLFVFSVFLIVFKLRTIPSPHRLPGWGKKIISFVNSALAGWDEVSKNKVLIAKMFILVMVNLLINTVTTFIEFRVLDIESSFFNILLYSAISSLSVFISITPAALGIKEGILVFTSEVIGITPLQVIQASVLDRGLMFFVLLILFVSARFSEGGRKVLSFNQSVKENPQI